MYKLITLPNGLRVITEYIEYVNSVSVGLLVNSGSRNENEENKGISHFIEHMLFKGTKNRSSKKIAEDIENVGGQINAYTSKESTCYYIKTLDTHLDLALEVLSDMLLNSKFDEVEIKKEKGVVVEEINMNDDMPEEVLFDIHAKATFGEHSLSLPILGSKETVKAFSRDKIFDYLNKNYVPKNSVISICGNFDIKKLEELVTKYFGEWKLGESPIISDVPKIKNDFIHMKKNIEQLHIALGMKGVPMGDSKSYGLVLLNNIFGGSTSSILFQKIREEMGICYSVYSYLLPYKNVGTLNIYAGLNSDYSEKALMVIKEELEKFVEVGVSKEQLSINKEKIKASYILGLESTSGRMFSNGKSVLFLNRIKDPKEIIKKVDAIDYNMIHEVLEECFNPGIQNGAFLGKKIDNEKLSVLCQKDILI